MILHDLNAHRQIHELQESGRPNQCLLRIGIRKSASRTACNLDIPFPSVDWPQHQPLPPPLRCIPFLFLFPFLCLCLSIQCQQRGKALLTRELDTNLGKQIERSRIPGLHVILPKTKETASPFSGFTWEWRAFSEQLVIRILGLLS